MKTKNLIIKILIVFSLVFNGGVLGGQVYAQNTGTTTPKTTTTPANTTPPTGSLQGDSFQFDLGSITNNQINPTNWRQQGINFILERAVAIMAGTIGSAAVLMMVVGGFMMLASAGREEWYTRGKAYATKAAIGLVFVLGAYVIVTTVQLLVRSLF